MGKSVRRQKEKKKLTLPGIIIWPELQIFIILALLNQTVHRINSCNLIKKVFDFFSYNRPVHFRSRAVGRLFVSPEFYQ